MDIFLDQLIQFYSNNAINLHHLTTHSTTVLTNKMAIVLRQQICDVISPYLYCNDGVDRGPQSAASAEAISVAK